MLYQCSCSQKSKRGNFQVDYWLKGKFKARKKAYDMFVKGKSNS